MVGCAFPKFNFLKINIGIRLMLAPKSHKAFSKTSYGARNCKATWIFKFRG